jgi:beta-ureidopropionase
VTKIVCEGIMLRLAVAQMESRVNEFERNMSKMKSLLTSAREQDVDVLVLPKCINSGYAFENREEVMSLSEEIPNGPFSKELAKWSKHGGMVVAGLSEKTAEGPYDSGVVFSGGRHLATYRKIHLYGKDKEWFLPGKEEPKVVEFNNYRFGMILGFDWAFPEVTRILALKGAQIIFHPNSLLQSYCHRAMITRSIENRIFTATSSRVGEDRGFRFIGGSQVTDPRGHVLLRMDYDEEDIAWIDIEPAAADNKVIEGNDIIKDRRPELYGKITEVK